MSWLGGKAKMLDKAIAVASWIESKYDAQPNLHVYTSLIQARFLHDCPTCASRTCQSSNKTRRARTPAHTHIPTFEFQLLLVNYS
eukprot:2959688-Amphidinium_carterae.1